MLSLPSLQLSWLCISFLSFCFIWHHTERRELLSHNFFLTFLFPTVFSSYRTLSHRTQYFDSLVLWSILDDFPIISFIFVTISLLFLPLTRVQTISICSLSFSPLWPLFLNGPLIHMHFQFYSTWVRHTRLHRSIIVSATLITILSFSHNARH